MRVTHAMNLEVELRTLVFAAWRSTCELRHLLVGALGGLSELIGQAQPNKYN